MNDAGVTIYFMLMAVTGLLVIVAMAGSYHD